MAISAKVAKLISGDELVINKGKRDGVQVGMLFTIKDERLDNIVDPDTGESLGSIDRPKVVIRITRLGDRAALGRRHEESPTFSNLIAAMQVRPQGILSGDSWSLDDVEVGDLAVWDGKRVLQTL